MTATGGERLVLRAMRPRDEAAAWAAHRELAAEGFPFLLFAEPGRSWSDCLDRLERERAGVDLPEGRVPATFLVAEVDGVVVGRVSVRHELNEHLAQVGGHIGCAVRPSFRRRGYATAMLREALAVARGLGIDRALVTCDDDNLASITVIERCGGELQDVVSAGAGEKPRRRYWIDTHR